MPWGGSRCPNPARHWGLGVPTQGRCGWAGQGGEDGSAPFSVHAENKISVLEKSPCWRAAPHPSNPKTAAEMRQCPGLGRVGSGGHREPFHHRGKWRGANEANLGSRYKFAVLFSAWSYPHGAGDIFLSAREKGRVLMTKSVSQPQPHHSVSRHTGESPAPWLASGFPGSFCPQSSAAARK